MKLPVTDLARSQDWYRTRPEYRTQMEFREQDRLMGVAMSHPAGGPGVALRLDPHRAGRCAGFDFFAIGVPDEAGVVAPADRFSSLDEPHTGVHRTPIGWVLTGVHDPDGYEIRFYADGPDGPEAAGSVVVRDEARDAAHLAGSAGPSGVA